MGDVKFTNVGANVFTCAMMLVVVFRIYSVAKLVDATSVASTVSLECNPF